MSGEHTVSEVIVIGTRWTLAAGGVGSGTGDRGRETDEQPNYEGGGGTSVTQEDIRREDKRLTECAAARFAATLELEGELREDKKEYFTHTWERDGAIVTHAPRGGSGVYISRTEFNAAKAEFAIQDSAIVALNHNHPKDEYCPTPPLGSGSLSSQQRNANAYPSLNDWGYAGSLVNGEADRDRLTLYVTGCNGQTRVFAYSQRAQFEAALANGDVPPEPIAPINCPA